MDDQKRKGSKPKFGNTRSPGSKDNRARGNLEGTIDASPGEAPGNPMPGSTAQHGARSIHAVARDICQTAAAGHRDVRLSC